MIRLETAFLRKLFFAGMVIAFSFLFTGCSGMAEGITKAIMGDEDEVDNRKCWIQGRSFDGIEMLLDQDNGGSEKPVLKVLMVHGIGSHSPGYSTRLAENLARELKLNQVQEKVKSFPLKNAKFNDQNLGSLRISRYMTKDMAREMLFYELTWDPIVEEEKRTINFDNSGDYAFRRTGVNNTLKLFVNDTVPDVLMYNGRFRPLVQASVGQAMCWMMSENWQTLPYGEAVACNAEATDKLGRLQDHYVIVTHSLGSRVTADALQTIALMAQDTPSLAEKLKPWKDKEFIIFMLSNQLPLLQLGQPAPEVSNSIDTICRPGAPEASSRLFKEVKIVAFSDPNDLFGYAIPPKFLDDYMDSRLCPTLTNVVLNVAEVNDFLGFGEYANPLAAHTEYDNDERVIGLITKGIGTDKDSRLVTERCEWLEAITEEQ